MHVDCNFEPDWGLVVDSTTVHKADDERRRAGGKQEITVSAGVTQKEKELREED